MKIHYALLCAMVSGTAFAAPDDNRYGRWSEVFDWPIIPIHVSMLPNGKVFSFGTDENGNQGAQFNYAVWNPAGGFRSHQLLPNTTAVDTFCAGNALMPTGNVLMAGGDTRWPINNGIKANNVFVPSSQKIEPRNGMNWARWYPTTTTLPNGETLIHGGFEKPGMPIHTPEAFKNGNVRVLWNAGNEGITGDAEAKWFYPRNFVAPNGRVFGMSGSAMYFLDWGGNGGTQLAGNLPQKTLSHTSTAVMYRPGKIFQAGGSVNGDTRALASNQAITVDVNSGWPQVTPLPDMKYRRAWGNSTVLPNGEVFISGGSAYENQLTDTAQMAEMWQPNNGQFRDLRPAALPRLYHSISLLLQDGSVLTGGGGAPGPLTNTNAEIYYPPYLFDGAGNFAQRPVIGAFDRNLQYGYQRDIGFSNAVGISRVTLVRMGSVTHSFDMGQRFMDLPFTQNGNSVKVTFPNSRNNAPPGYYFVFFFNRLGVPSIAKIVGIEAAAVPN